MRRRPVVAIALAAVLAAPLASQPTGRAQEVGRIVWQEEAAHFGGFSGLEVGPDGVNFTALSDRGYYVEGRFLRDAEGGITGIAAGALRPLVPPRPGAWPPYLIDSEGLAMAPGGPAFVSFEGLQKVFRLKDMSAPAHPLPQHRDFPGMIGNASLEALAIGPDGALYTLPERSGRKDRPFPLYRFRDGRWSRLGQVARRGSFLPVGADIGPDGRFYLLERQFSLIRGFASRVRRFDLDETGLSNEQVLFESGAGRFYDLEGLAVWRDGDGRIRLTMISDDNFNFLQLTEVVEYVVRDGLASPGESG